MSMRLMPKSEIQAALASDKKQKIEEGVRVARKIDALRQTLAEEEASLQKFRIKQIKAINDEIKPLGEKRDALKIEVAELVKKRKELLKPLDKEWLQVREAKEKASQDASDARILLSQAHETEREAQKAVKQAADELTRVANKSAKATELLEQAVLKESEAEEHLRHAKLVNEDAVRRAEEAREEFKVRDNSLALQERSVMLKEANLKESEAELAKGWKLLEDRQKTFERTIKRAKK